MASTRAASEKAAVSPARKPPFAIYQPTMNTTYLKFGLYGDSGVGKTTLSATAPNPLLLNIEAGDAALLGQDIDVVKIETFGETGKVFKFLKNDPHDYETVIIDSLTELHKRAMDLVLKEEGREMPHQGSWGHSMELIRRIVRAFRDLDMHVIFVMGLQERQDQLTGAVMEMPNLPGKLGNEIIGYFDILGYYTMAPRRGAKGVYDRKLMLQPSMRYKAKDRTGRLGASIEGDDLNIEHMIARIRDGERVQEDVVDDLVAGMADFPAS